MTTRIEGAIEHPEQRRAADAQRADERVRDADFRRGHELVVAIHEDHHGAILQRLLRFLRRRDEERAEVDGGERVRSDRAQRLRIVVLVPEQIAIDERLQLVPQRHEQQRHDERRGDDHGLVVHARDVDQQRSQSPDEHEIHDDDRAAENRVDDGLADDDVDVHQPVFEDRGGEGERNDERNERRDEIESLEYGTPLDDRLAAGPEPERGDGGYRSRENRRRKRRHETPHGPLHLALLLDAGIAVVAHERNRREHGIREKEQNGNHDARECGDPADQPRTATDCGRGEEEPEDGERGTERPSREGPNDSLGPADMDDVECDQQTGDGESDPRPADDVYEPVRGRRRIRVLEQKQREQSEQQQQHDADQQRAGVDPADDVGPSHDDRAVAREDQREVKDQRGVRDRAREEQQKRR
ncbi:MAG TPA: hypothetical protein VNA69_02630 [Thermoanaerobaculia bacterium]|nr:hypothetical protein [Thermoanaerobaculia bacterium]